MKGLGLEPNLGLFGWVKKLNPTFTREPYINSGKVYKKHPLLNRASNGCLLFKRRIYTSSNIGGLSFVKQ